MPPRTTLATTTIRENPTNGSKPATVEQVQEHATRIIHEVAQVIVGKRDVLELVTLNLLAGGNILFEDYPGLAKSLMADTFARASGCKFKRIQFTPDLLPSDITGAYIFDQKEVEFKFRPGPVFTNILLADEINRAPPKTQAALLETMAERQVTIEGVTRKLEAPYVVMATQNPTEQEGVYPLPEAQNDRFMMKMSVGYPNEEEEFEVLARRMRRGKDQADVRAVTSPAELVRMQNACETVHVDPLVMRYVVKLVHATRSHPQVQVGSSPRGTLALLKLARANAALHGRTFVVPDDVKRVTPGTLGHRIMLKAEPRLRGVRAEDVVRSILASTPVPTVARR